MSWCDSMGDYSALKSWSYFLPDEKAQTFYLSKNRCFTSVYLTLNTKLRERERETYCDLTASASWDGRDRDLDLIPRHWSLGGFSTVEA